MKINSVGIVGLGSFGKFVASLVPKGIAVYGYDKDPALKIKNVHSQDFAKVVSADIVVWAVPLSEYVNMLPILKQHLKPTTLFVDVCSVKVFPERLLAEYLPDHPNLMLTHPLFGPQSATKSTIGHKLIITKAKGKVADQMITFCQDTLRLSIRHMTSDKHDQIMANVHALTFFVARGLADIHIDRGPFITPSYQMIIDLVAFSDTHSQELFDTVQLGNPYAEATRQQLLQSLQDSETKLSKGTSLW